jgi:hypothetical protein
MVNSRIDSPDLPFAGSPSLQLRWKEGLFLSKRHCEARSNLYAIQSDSVSRGLLRASQ